MQLYIYNFQLTNAADVLNIEYNFVKNQKLIIHLKLNTIRQVKKNLQIIS